MRTKDIFLFILIFPLFYFSQNSYLDTSFNGSGKFFLDTVFQYPNNSTEYITDVVEQPDGKVICLGTSHSSSGFFEPIFGTVFRLNIDGTLDSSFGNNGVFRYSTYMAQKNLFNVTSKILLQNDGSMIISGAGYEEGSNLNSDIVFLKINSDGLLDTTFGINGIARLPLISGNLLELYDVISHNNVIYVAGRISNDGFIGSINFDGSINTNFNGVGTLIVDDASTSYNNFQRLKIVSNKLLAIGLSENSSFNVSLSIARVFLDGTIDPTYGIGGISVQALIAEENKKILDCAIFPNDKIFTIVGGNFYQLTKYGILDTTFGVNGFIKNPHNESFSAATITHDKKIILSKYIIDGPFVNYQLYKTVGLKADLTIDSGYMNNGQVLTNVMEPNHYYQYPAKVVLLSTGKTLVIGSVTVLPNSNVPSIKNQNYVVLRYIRSPNLHTQENSKKMNIVYPTFVSDIVNINTKERLQNIKVYDVSGRQVKNFINPDNKIDLKELKLGNYIIQVTTEKSSYQTKITKYK